MREAAGFGDAAHQRGDEGAVLRARQPLAFVLRPLGLAHHAAVGADANAGQRADAAVERLVRRLQAERHAGLLQHTVPAADAGDRVADVVVAQHLVQGVEHRYLALDQAAVGHAEHGVGAAVQAVVVVALRFLEAPLQPRVVEGRRVARLVGAEQVDRHAEVEVEIALDRRQVDHAGGAQPVRIVGSQLVHHLAGALDHARDARLADEHVVRFLGQHEARRAGQRVEAAFGERAQLVLAVAVGEVGEHEERQPVGRPLVEGAEDARVVGIPRAALEQRLGFLAAVAAEMLVQQVDHRPQVAAFLDVDLEEIPKVVLARAGQAEVALLLDRGRLGVALGDDDPAKIGAVLARHFLPRRLALVAAEVDLPARLRVVEEDAPAVVGHLHVVEVRPAAGLDADRRAQVHVEVVRAVRPHLLPPRQVVGLPVLERALQRLVLGEADVVGDLLAVIDGRHGIPG